MFFLAAHQCDGIARLPPHRFFKNLGEADPQSPPFHRDTQLRCLRPAELDGAEVEPTHDAAPFRYSPRVGARSGSYSTMETAKLSSVSVRRWTPSGRPANVSRRSTQSSWSPCLTRGRIIVTLPPPLF